MVKLAAMFADSRGATSAEYAVLLAIVGTALALASVALGASISCSLTNTAAWIAGKEPHNPSPGKSDPKGNAFGHRCG